MVIIKKIKKIVKEENKKIGGAAIKKLNKILEKKALKILRKAVRNSDFYGRVTIKEEDIEE